ncbi:tyramine receptor Ser-2-like isoform X2 [Aplysia californica]|nr:tyramine receptor Ser-2-like isoform X2 [Aplysia californica]
MNLSQFPYAIDRTTTVAPLLPTMDSPNTTEGLTEEEHLEILNRQRVMYYIPAMIWVGVLMFIGVIGNSLVVYVYRRRFKKTSSNYFILTMAVFDLISCAIGMPFELYDLNNPFTFYSTAGCKILRGCVTFTIFGSAIILVEIAFDRYFKICRPLMVVSLSKIRMLCVLAVFLAFLLSVPPIILFGTTRTNTSIPNVRGHDCSIAEEYKKSTFQTAFYTTLAAIFVVILLILTVLYTRIWLEIRCRRRFVIGDQIAREADGDNRTMRIRYVPSLSEDESCNNTVCQHHHNGSMNELQHIYSNRHHQRQQSHNLSSQQQQQQQRLQAGIPSTSSSASTGERRSKIGSSLASYASRLKVTRTTVVLFAVTVAFILSYLPSIAVMVIRSVDKDFESTQSVASLAVLKIFSNCFFINNAINPIIYSFLNINFRRQVKKTVRRVLCCFRRRRYPPQKMDSDRSTKKEFILKD